MRFSTRIELHGIYPEKLGKANMEHPINQVQVIRHWSELSDMTADGSQDDAIGRLPS